MLVLVEQNDIERALKVLGRKLLRDGRRRELRRHEHYIPPGERRRLQKKRAIARRRRAEARRSRAEAR